MDNRDAAETLSMVLKLDGHEAECVFDPADALDRARTFCPEIVLLDLGLPGIDGYKVARRLRAMPELNGVAIVALSGYGMRQDRDRTAAASFDAHLVKPASFEDLARVLSRS